MPAAWVSVLTAEAWQHKVHEQLFRWKHLLGCVGRFTSTPTTSSQKYFISALNLFCVSLLRTALNWGFGKVVWTSSSGRTNELRTCPYFGAVDFCSIFFALTFHFTRICFRELMSSRKMSFFWNYDPKFLSDVTPLCLLWNSFCWPFHFPERTREIILYVCLVAPGFNADWQQNSQCCCVFLHSLRIPVLLRRCAPSNPAAFCCCCCGCFSRGHELTDWLTDS